MTRCPVYNQRPGRRRIYYKLRKHGVPRDLAKRALKISEIEEVAVYRWLVWSVGDYFDRGFTYTEVKVIKAALRLPDINYVKHVVAHEEWKKPTEQVDLFDLDYYIDHAWPDD